MGARRNTSSIVAIAEAFSPVEGLPRMAETSPEGLVTLMFTDIEGSTELLERIGERPFVDLLQEHNLIVREQAAAKGGRVVKSHGDGFMLLFSSSRAGLRCAIDLQRSLSAWAPRGEERPRVRIGLHAGSVIEDDDDVLGRTVILAARIADQARGEEILVSDALKEYAGGDPGFRFEPRAPAKLKGFSSAHRIHAVRWSD